MRPALRRASAALAVAASILGSGCGEREASAPPGDPVPALGTWLPTNSATARISLRPESPPAPVGRLHRWLVHFETPDGRPFEPTRITVGGGMPQHGHGFVTEPRVTRGLGAGAFLIEGVKFHMSGEWTLHVAFSGPAGDDDATVRVQIDP